MLRAPIETDSPQHLPELDFHCTRASVEMNSYQLTWESVDFERLILTVAQSKNGETRHLPLNSTALSPFLLLKRHSAAARKVFANSRPRRWFDPALEESRSVLWGLDENLSSLAVSALVERLYGALDADERISSAASSERPELPG